MTPSPILKVLSTIRRNGVRSLLMGGQACVLYGGAEFSRDTDIMVVADAANRARLEAAGSRLDVMATVRGLPDFETVWRRRTTLETPAGAIEVLSLPDLVTAKKTQRDKDWPMVARLVEAHYARHAQAPDEALRDFWLREARSASLLIDIARSAPHVCARLQSLRPLLEHAASGSEARLVEALRAEEDAERAADRLYWAPLKQELERLRHAR